MRQAVAAHYDRRFLELTASALTARRYDARLTDGEVTPLIFIVRSPLSPLRLGQGL
jgi:hypothetical protein